MNPHVSAQRSSGRELPTTDSANPLGVMFIANIMSMAVMVITVIIMISSHRYVLVGFATITWRRIEGRRAVGMIGGILVGSSGGFNQLLEELPLLLRVRVRVRVEARFQKQGDEARGGATVCSSSSSSSRACVHHELKWSGALVISGIWEAGKSLQSSQVID